MKTIWKYPIPIIDRVALDLPIGADVLCVATQGQIACLWALVDPDADKIIRRFRWYGTGHPIDPIDERYVGTVFAVDGQLVFHLFEIIERGMTPELENRIGTIVEHG